MKPRSLFLCLALLPFVLLASVLSVRALNFGSPTRCETEYQDCLFNAGGDPELYALCADQLNSCNAAGEEPGGDGGGEEPPDGGGDPGGGGDQPAPSNSLPVAIDDAVSIQKNKIALIAVLANDYDPDGDALQIVGVSAPGHGVATAQPDGTIAYNPKNGFKGVDTFTYTITDGVTGNATATVTVEVGAKKKP